MVAMQFDETLNYPEKEIAFCKSYVKTNNGKLSVIKAGYAKKNTGVIASNMLKKEKIRTLIKSLTDEVEMSIRSYFLIDALEARNVLREIQDNKDNNPMIRYQVAKDFLDRAGIKAPEKQEVNQQRNICFFQRRLSLDINFVCLSGVI